MDGEADDFLHQLGQNETARACWYRFHLIRTIIRDGQMLLGTDFHKRVMQSLENEPTVFAPKTSLRRKLPIEKQHIKSIAGLAIAATVAAVTVLGFQNFYSPEQGTLMLSSLNDDSAVPAVMDYASENNLVSTEAEMILARDAIGNELDSYLVGHMEQTTGGGNAQGMLPYARLAGYDDSQ
jgi:negative regulator of sigma E activity